MDRIAIAKTTTTTTIRISFPFDFIHSLFALLLISPFVGYGDAEAEKEEAYSHDNHPQEGPALVNVAVAVIVDLVSAYFRCRAYLVHAVAPFPVDAGSDALLAGANIAAAGNGIIGQAVSSDRLLCIDWNCQTGLSH